MKPKHPLRSFFPLPAIVLAGALCLPVAQAAIVVQNTDFDTVGPFGGGTHTLSSFALSGGTKLVVTTATEGLDASGITFAGQPLTRIENIVAGGQRAEIWYLDTPIASSGDIVVSYNSSGNSSSGIAALSISGADLGFLDSSSATGRNSGTLTIDPGSLVVGSFNTNQSATMITPAAPSTLIFAEQIWPNSGTTAAASYFIETDPATRTSYAYTGGSNTNPIAAAVSFAVAIPEPSAALLGSFGMLFLLRRRRA